MYILSPQSQKVTRGHGLLEPVLARLRSRRANRLIADSARTERILDVGFGSYPLFLKQTRFSERYGLDREVPEDQGKHLGLQLIALDLNECSEIPFENEFFDVVTMLAVFEHLDERVLASVVREINRVLAQGGLFVMTTPARWTTGILNWMARIGIVSTDEVGEHWNQYTRSEIVEILRQGGFDPQHVETGSFELGMNLWARARRTLGAQRD